MSQEVSDTLEEMRALQRKMYSMMMAIRESQYELLETQQELAERMNKRKIKRVSHHMEYPELLDTADKLMPQRFSLGELREQLPDYLELSDRVIGSTLLRNGYRKIQTRDGEHRHWVYARTKVVPQNVFLSHGRLADMPAK